jgi:hypothetical protein
MLFLETLIKVRMFIIGKNKSGDKLKDQWKKYRKPKK